MGIKTVKYKSNSIVYFKGDAPSRVYILKKGSIVSKGTDLKTNEDVLTMIKVGEFIGVKNVISNQPYSETVSTLTDSELVVFYKEDFENFILTNNRVMMQTLVVFSNQLRKIHKDIKDLNKDTTKQKSSGVDEDLFELGKYFQLQMKTDYSKYCFNKYKELYPSGKFIDAIDNGSTYASFDSGDDFDEPDKNNDSDLYYQEGLNYLEETNYNKAKDCFTKVIETGGENLVDATFFNGFALFNLFEYKACIKNYASFLSKHKDYKKIEEVLFYVGCSYRELGDVDQAKQFLKQVVKRAEGKPLAQEAHKVLKEL